MSTLSPVSISERFIMIALVCSIALHLLFAAFNIDMSSKPKKEEKPIIVELIKKPQPVVETPKPIIKPTPESKPKKVEPIKKKPKVIKKPKPVVKKVVKPVAIPTPSPVIVPEPDYKPLPEIIPEPTPEPEPLPEPTPQPVVEPVVETPPPPPGPSAAEIDAAKGAYKRLLQQSINQHKSYPRIAKTRGWQGKVIIQFNLDSNGNILEKTIIQSSGHNVLDKAALKMAEKAAPFPRPPEILQGRSFNIKVPIPFKLASPQ